MFILITSFQFRLIEYFKITRLLAKFLPVIKTKPGEVNKAINLAVPQSKANNTVHYHVMFYILYLYTSIC